MKKKLIVVLAILVVAAGGVFGYFYQAGYFGSVARVDPVPAQELFESATPEVLAKVQPGFDAIEADDLGLALAILDELSYELLPEVDITTEQQATLMDLAEQIRTKLGDKAEAAMEEGQKKLEELRAGSE